jgi:phosphoribosylformylglycinamidine synthase
MISNFTMRFQTSNFSLQTSKLPHPERLFRSVQMSYKPTDQFTGEAGPWLKMFQNARAYIG